MLSNLPKLADRNFVIGFFLPALFGLVATAWVYPDATLVSALHDLKVSDKDLKDLVYVVLTTWLTAVLLVTANYWIYRLYEGYTFPLTWMRLLKVRKWERLTRRYEKLADEYSVAHAAKQDLPAGKMTQLIELGARLYSDYPTEESDILPTRFGNRIRAFEVYSRNVYGADSIPVWDRLVSVIPKAFMDSINESRSQVDLYLNISFIALCFLLIQISSMLWGLGWDVRGWTWTALLMAANRQPLIEMSASLLVAVLSYWLASHAVLNWGRSVKSAFDCYLPSLLTQMGYDIRSVAERKLFWTEFSQLASYGDPLSTIWSLRGPNEATTTEPAHEADASETANGEKTDTEEET